MLSDRDRRTLAEIERHLQEDAGLCRTFGRSPRAFVRSRCRFARSWRRMSGMRRVWVALLALSVVLMVATAVLHLSGAAFECAVLAVVIGTALWSTSTKVEPRAGRSVQDRRP